MPVVLRLLTVIVFVTVASGMVGSWKEWRLRGGHF